MRELVVTRRIGPTMDDRPQPARIFLINLDEDTDRLSKMVEQLASLGLTFERIPAFRGSALPGWLKTQFFGDDGQHLSAQTPGEVGCYASHLAVCRRIVDEGIEGPVLVLEDDAELGKDFLEVLDQIARLPGDWEMVRLSSSPRSAYVPVVRLTSDHDLVRYWTLPSNTAGYLINREGAAKLQISSEKRLRPIDRDLRRFWETKLSTYGLVPPAIGQRAERSSIDRVSGRSRGTIRKRFRMSHSDRWARIGAAVQMHGLRTSARCVLANMAADVFKLLGAKERAARMYRVMPRRGAAKAAIGASVRPAPR